MLCFIQTKNVKKNNLCTLNTKNLTKKKVHRKRHTYICERVRKKYFEFTWINGSHYTESVAARGYAHPFKSKVIFFL